MIIFKPCYYLTLINYFYQMRNYLTVCTLLLFAACSGEQTTGSMTDGQENTSPATNHPEALKNILDAHGGLDLWNSTGSLYFELARGDGNEKHYVQLADRRDRIEGTNFTMGFDGVDVWMEADTSYQGNPEFYHNLMFYFFAMPFVLADSGINYEQAPSFSFDGVTYNGLAVSFDDGVGSSPKDEYFIYFNPENNQMAWLGYTVTFFSGESSESVKWIRYHDWDEVNQLILPATITWYQSENGIPTISTENQVDFTNVKLEKQTFPDSLFKGP